MKDTTRFVRLLAGRLTGLTLAATAAAEHPNVIIVMTDDQGFGELSCHGNPLLQTWFLDAKGRSLCAAYYVYVEKR